MALIVLVVEVVDLELLPMEVPAEQVEVHSSTSMV
jgi:hypothetical protein